MKIFRINLREPILFIIRIYNKILLHDILFIRIKYYYILNMFYKKGYYKHFYVNYKFL